MRQAGDKRPLGVHLREVERVTGRKPEALIEAEAEAPLAVAYLEQWFHELVRAKPNYGFGPARLTYTDVYSWARLTRRSPTPQEVECLLLLDGIFIETVTAKESKDG